MTDLSAGISALLDFSSADNRALLQILVSSALGAGGGAATAVGFLLHREETLRLRDIQATCNITIATLVALLGKLINFKKDLAFPAQAEAQSLPEGAKPRLALWAEIPFELRLPNQKIYEYAEQDLDLIQLLKMLEFNLAELAFLVQQRNALVNEIKSAPHAENIALYAKTAGLILRNTDENLFFIDKAIGKVRSAGMKLLPARLRRGIADVGLKPETQPLMPPKDLIRGWVR